MTEHYRKAIPTGDPKDDTYEPGRISNGRSWLFVETQMSGEQQTAVEISVPAGYAKESVHRIAYLPDRETVVMLRDALEEVLEFLPGRDVRGKEERALFCWPEAVNYLRTGSYIRWIDWPPDTYIFRRRESGLYLLHEEGGRETVWSPHMAIFRVEKKWELYTDAK